MLLSRYAVSHSSSAGTLWTRVRRGCGHQATGHNDPIVSGDQVIQTIRALCSHGLVSTLTDFVLVVRRSVFGSFYTAFGTPELIFPTIPEKCTGNPTFQPYASGGDGSAVQFCS